MLRKTLTRDEKEVIKRLANFRLVIRKGLTRDFESQKYRYVDTKNLSEDKGWISNFQLRALGKLGFTQRHEYDVLRVSLTNVKKILECKEFLYRPYKKRKLKKPQSEYVFRLRKTPTSIRALAEAFDFKSEEYTKTDYWKEICTLAKEFETILEKQLCNSRIGKLPYVPDDFLEAYFNGSLLLDETSLSPRVERAMLKHHNLMDILEVFLKYHCYNPSRKEEPDLCLQSLWAMRDYLEARDEEVYVLRRGQKKLWSKFNEAIAKGRWVQAS